MAGGRPTQDPKGKLVAVRLASRQVQALTTRARRENIALSEALRRVVDEWAAASASRSQVPTAARARPPTPEERKTFDQVFAALGITRRRRRGLQR